MLAFIDEKMNDVHKTFQEIEDTKENMKEMQHKWDDLIQNINEAVIKKALEEKVVKKAMDIKIEDFSIQDTYLAYHTKACETCRNGLSCDRHQFVKQHFIRMLQQNKLDEEIIEYYTKKQKTDLLYHEGGKLPLVYRTNNTEQLEAMKG